MAQKAFNEEQVRRELKIRKLKELRKNMQMRIAGTYKAEDKPVEKKEEQKNSENAEGKDLKVVKQLKEDDEDKDFIAEKKRFMQFGNKAPESTKKTRVMISSNVSPPSSGDKPGKKK